MVPVTTVLPSPTTDVRESASDVIFGGTRFTVVLTSGGCEPIAVLNAVVVDLVNAFAVTRMDRAVAVGLVVTAKDVLAPDTDTTSGMLRYAVSLEMSCIVT
jgi:hypothetical protein